MTCDCDGKCSCKLNIVGDSCDQCEIEHYDFPNCNGMFIFKIQICTTISIENFFGNILYET